MSPTVIARRFRKAASSACIIVDYNTYKGQIRPSVLQAVNDSGQRCPMSMLRTKARRSSREMKVQDKDVHTAVKKPLDKDVQGAYYGQTHPQEQGYENTGQKRPVHTNRTKTSTGLGENYWTTTSSEHTTGQNCPQEPILENTGQKSPMDSERTEMSPTQ